MAKGGKDDLDLTAPKSVGEVLKIDPDPILGRWDLLLVFLERIAVAVEDVADMMEGDEEDDVPEDGGEKK